MSPSAEGSAAPSGAVDNYPSTLPGPNHNWQITLEGKVIASKFYSCLGVLAVKMANFH